MTETILKFIIYLELNLLISNFFLKIKDEPKLQVCRSIFTV